MLILINFFIHFMCFLSWKKHSSSEEASTGKNFFYDVYFTIFLSLSKKNFPLSLKMKFPLKRIFFLLFLSLGKVFFFIIPHRGWLANLYSFSLCVLGWIETSCEVSMRIVANIEPFPNRVCGNWGKDFFLLWKLLFCFFHPLARRIEMNHSSHYHKTKAPLPDSLYAFQLKLLLISTFIFPPVHFHHCSIFHFFLLFHSDSMKITFNDAHHNQIKHTQAVDG